MANRTDYIAIIKSDEYKNKLKKMAQDIKMLQKLLQMRQQLKVDLTVNCFPFLKICSNHWDLYIIL